MPIRFACKNCGVRLSVSTRKAGTQAQCPKCRGNITIPQAEPVADGDAPAASAAQPAAEAAREASQPDDPFAQFAVFDVESELVYDHDYEMSPAEAALGPVDPNKLAVPRTVLYAQGAALGLVALFSFAIGVMVGLGAAGDSDDVDQAPQACLIRGAVVVQDSGETRPDIGAVAIVLPRDFHPEQKAEIVGLRPQDPLPGDNYEGLDAIKGIGGDYVRADDQGQFQLRVPDRGNYFLLVISASASRGEGEQPKTVLAQIGRFFQLTPNLFEGHAYRWREEIVRRDRELNIVFP